jgi:hypothetical protein
MIRIQEVSPIRMGSCWVLPAVAVVSWGHSVRAEATWLPKPGPTRRGTYGADDSFKRLFTARRLHKTARALRAEVRSVRARDVIDWLDWFVALERSIPELRASILDGTYAASPPSRYEYPKARGAFRTITVPSIRDAVVFRHLADESLNRAVRSKVQGAFFSRRFTSTPVGPTFKLDPADPYHKFFAIWLAYNQYRTKTMLNSPHDVLVVTDISNFFDSIQHELLLEYLAPLGLPRKAIGLLGRLLETFKPRAGHSPNPRVGIPQDELDCSRELAHVFLFEHDRRVVGSVGEARYVRWMDDQNIGASSMAEGRTIVNLITRSLASQLLTVNAGKTKFLTPPEVIAHFQLGPNEQLDAWADKWGYPKVSVPRAARHELRRTWTAIESGGTAGVGNWDKILKRMYALAVQVDMPDLESRAFDDLVTYPDLDERIFGYFARRNRVRALMDLFSAYRTSKENLFESTESAFFEAALLLRPSSSDASELGSIARLHSRAQSSRRRALPRASAVLLQYWLGVNAPSLGSLFTSPASAELPKEVARTWMAVSFARDQMTLPAVQSALLGHPSDDVPRLARFLEGIQRGTLGEVGPLPEPKARWPLPGFYVDARGWLVLEILSHSPNPNLKRRVRFVLGRWLPTVTGFPERRIAERIAARIM